MIFRRIPLYLKIWTNRMDVIRLDNGASLSMDADPPFSNSRIVLANFQEAEAHLKLMIGELVGRGRFTPGLKIVVQQMERCEGGLSTVELRALVDSCEHAGAIRVKVVGHDRALSPQEALDILRAE